MDPTPKFLERREKITLKTAGKHLWRKLAMNELTASPRAAQPPTTRLARTILSAAILLALIGGFFAVRAWTNPPPSDSQPAAELVSAGVLEERYGMQIKLIGVTGGGGLIDFRFKVLDHEKAELLLQSPADLPVLIVADGDTTLNPPAVKPEDMRLESDSVYFMLYPNPGGVVKPGAPVSVVMDDVRLEPITAQ
jgi:hypothetical protein